MDLKEKMQTLQDLTKERRELELRKKNFTKEISSRIAIITRELERIVMGENEIYGQMNIDGFVEGQD